MADPDSTRIRVSNRFDESDVLFDVSRNNGVIFTIPVKEVFKKGRNFDVFDYDPETEMIAIRPTKGMHQRMHNELQCFPSEEECSTVWNDNKLVIYHIYERPSDDYCPLEILRFADQEKWKETHPSAFSLLV